MTNGRQIRVDLTGKGALVTGASRGIGRAIAEALATNGAKVVVNYCTGEKSARELVESLTAQGAVAIAIRADVSRAGEIDTLFGQAREFLGGPVDILVNNAGSQIQKSSLEEMPLELWERVIRLNLTSAMLCSKLAIPDMKGNGWGRIINISSISAQSGGGPGGIPYASSKAGLIAFTKGLAKELGLHGVTVNAVAPGVILTELHEKFNTPENLEALRKATVLGDGRIGPVTRKLIEAWNERVGLDFIAQAKGYLTEMGADAYNGVSMYRFGQKETKS